MYTRIFGPVYDNEKPLLPLWAIQPVQSLSACTRVTFTFTFGHVQRMEENEFPKKYYI